MFTQQRTKTQHWKPLEKYRTDLIMDTEQAIRMLEPKLQNPYRILATRKLNKSEHQAATTMSEQNDKPTS
jgi:hypothetical protein